MFVLAACVPGKSIPNTTKTILVKGGTFVFGSSKPCKQEFTCDDVVQNGSGTDKIKPIYPPMEVNVKNFYIDQHEVTNAQYQYCVEMDVCPQRTFQTFPAASGVDYSHDPAYGDFPAVAITFRQAKIYCAFVGKRLPTEFEWELVASGDHLVKKGEDIATAEAEKLEFPNKYADEFADVYGKSCNGIQIPGCPAQSGLMPSPVGSNANDVVKLAIKLANGDVANGDVYDLTGNVSEWVRGIPVEPTGDTVNYVSCKADLPKNCKDPHWCFNSACTKDKTPPSDPDYCPDKCYANNDVSECKSKKGIFRMCEQQDSFKIFKGIPICIKYQVPITQEALFKKFSKDNQVLTKTVVMGCSYSNNCWGYTTDAGDFLCGTRSSARHILKLSPKSKTTDPQIGFRCAADAK